MKRVVIRITMLLLLFTLVGCAVISPQPATPIAARHLNWQQRQKQLQAIKNWNIKGAISITYNNKTDMASFSWKNNWHSYWIDIFGPLHLGSVQINGNENGAVLQQSSSGKIVRAATPEDLLQQQLQWPLPISNLNYWIRALPSPAKATALQFDSDHHLTSFTQQNWQIIYNAFQTVNGVDLPTKIYLTTPELRIKIVIKQWAEVG